MKKTPLVAPVVKWVGGKRQLLEDLIPLCPKRITSYCEPFVGGGALLFNRQPSVAYINDINEEIINVYRIIKDNVEELIAELKKYRNESDYFYTVREWDRDKNVYSNLSNVQKASRMIYLNKTCYNGLFRVNGAGEFNTPFGNYKNPNIVDSTTVKAVSSYFNSSTIYFSNIDYAEILNDIPKNTFVYLDPPYDPVSGTSNFTGYAKGGFDKNEQVRLRDCCADLDKRGIKFMLSNSATDFIRDLYHDYSLIIVHAKRTINSVSTKRGEIDEIVVRNYE